MAVIARCLLAACLATLSSAALAQSYDPEDGMEPVVAAPAPAWSEPRYDARRYRHHHRHYHGHARVERLAVPHVAVRTYSAPALPPVVRVAHTLPTAIIYAEPTPRTAYYNEPVIVDGLRTHRVAWRVQGVRCGEGCLRSAY